MFHSVNRSTVRSRLLRGAVASTALTGALLLPPLAHAQILPTGGAPVSGGVTVSNPTANANGGLDLTVIQTGARGIVNWRSFSVGQLDSITFNQPDASAATLNRVSGTQASTIGGRIIANGSVYLVNPNGIAITSTGSVQTGGGFIASTLNIADTDFDNGINSFTGSGASAMVSNGGSIAASGFAALLGGTVSNAGTISVPAGRVALGSGEAITLDINGANFLQVGVPTIATTANGKALIESDGTITGGRIKLSGASAVDAVRSIVNVTGTISADSASGNGGTILLTATGGGVVFAQGSLTARATGASGNGGTITLSGGQVGYAAGFANTTAAGGATGTTTLRVSGAYTERVSARPGSLLATTNLSIVAGGNISMPAFTGWTSNNALSLSAGGDIALGAVSGVNGALNLSAGGGAAYAGSVTNTNGVQVSIFNLTNGNWAQVGTLPSFGARDFRFSRSNATFLRVAGGDGSAATPYRITDAYGLQGMASSNQLGGNFVLANTIDASGTVDWNAGAGFVGIGTDAAPFTGSLNGRNGTARFAISGLTQNRADYGGLFGVLNGTLSDVDLTAVSITAPGNRAGAAAGIVNTTGRIANVGSSGRISGGSNVGGLVGSLRGGGVTDASSSAVIIGSGGSIGGLIGNMVSGSVLRGAASGTVNGVDRVGGLIGDVTNGATVTDSSASGVVTGTGTDVTLTGTGGLVGRLLNEVGTTSSITNSVATGAVNGAMNVGGLIGYQNAAGGGKVTVTASHATGAVLASGTNVGGLVGRINVSGTSSETLAAVASSYATGAVSTTSTSTISYVGGLVGQAIRGSNAALTLAINNAYATGAVRSGGNGVGGLVGFASYATLENVFATGSVTGSSSVGGLAGNAGAGTSVNSAYASGAVSGSNTNIGGLIGIRNATATTLTNAYWDRYSTGRTNGVGTGAAGGVSVSSDPNRGQGDASAYAEASYADLIKGASSIGTATPTGFVFLAGNSTRPFLAFEVPTAARAGAVPGDFASVRTIRNSHELQLIGYNAETLAGNYRLAAAIDLRETGHAAGANAADYAGMWAPTGFVSLGTDGAGNVWNGSNFVAIGSITGTTYGYGGTFDGGGFALVNLTVERPTAAYTGLFGVTNGTVRNVTLAGAVTGAGTTGGLVGFLFRGGTVTGSTASVAVTGTGSITGGLIGSMATGSTVSLSSAYGGVQGIANVGGLVGYASGARIDRSFAARLGPKDFGVGGTSYVGGLIGYAYNSAITDSFAAATVRASGIGAGGLIGKIIGGSVARTYSLGAAIAPRNAGGLIGQADSGTRVTSSYWNTDSGQTTSAGGTGKTSEEMAQQATYVGWDFGNVWMFQQGYSVPTLRGNPVLIAGGPQ